ncbi:YIP1 family protein [Halorussus gelatinilyticus]|uniref:YIP1 family protein n=1 Tax=Halorussus gelatinilyticus TaxID=2937524 RepID=A0A8U0IE33_9EURY|nr:Yip1 family protein [Halorussus gelatinilyticus]UPV99024.1 YIP1 family protein [Halorussus gelatinilyticus]
MVPTPLLRPDEFFAERAPGLSIGRAAAVVLVVALLTTVVVGAFGWTLSQRLTATTEIPNDERPPDWVCEGETNSEAEEMVQEGCDEPKQKTVVVGDLLWDAFSQRLPLVFVGVLFAWPLYAVALHVASAVVGGDGSFLDTLAVTAWGMLPSAFQAVVGFALLYTALGGIDLAASDPEMLASQIRSLSQRARGDTVLLSLAGAVWQGYVWTFGLKRARDLSTGGAAFAGGVVAVAVFLLSLA